MKYKSKLNLKNLNRTQKRLLAKKCKTMVDGNARYSAYVKGKFNDAYNAAIAGETMDAAIEVKLDELKADYTNVEVNDKLLDDTLTKAGNAIQDNANDDATYFEQAGVEYYETGRQTPIVEIDPPTGFAVTHSDNAGEVDFMCDPVKKGNVDYVIEWTLDNNGLNGWSKDYVFKKSSGALTGLTPGQHIYLRIRVVGHNAESSWSQSIVNTTVPF